MFSSEGVGGAVYWTDLFKHMYYNYFMDYIQRYHNMYLFIFYVCFFNVSMFFFVTHLPTLHYINLI